MYINIKTDKNKKGFSKNFIDETKLNDLQLEKLKNPELTKTQFEYIKYHMNGNYHRPKKINNPEYNKDYHIKNKEEINRKCREYSKLKYANTPELHEIITCDCGREHKRGSIKSHIKSKQHINYLNSI